MPGGRVGQRDAAQAKERPCRRVCAGRASAYPVAPGNMEIPRLSGDEYRRSAFDHFYRCEMGGGYIEDRLYRHLHRLTGGGLPDAKMQKDANSETAT